jgi:hypothetical protein
MNKILNSAGFAVVGVVGLSQAAVGQEAMTDDAKWWSVSAAVRGFYDSNPGTAPSPSDDSSYGFEIRPSLEAAYNTGDTAFRGKILYSYRDYFEDGLKDENTILLDLALDHNFSERSRISVADQFAYTSEPTLLEQGSTVTAPQKTLRSDGTNIRNFGEIGYEWDFTPVWGIGVGYSNLWYDYEEDGSGSYSALLDRIEQMIRLDLRYRLNTDLTAVLGYQFGLVDFTSDDGLYPAGTPGAVPGSKADSPDSRDSNSQFIVVGADYAMGRQLTAKVRGGAQYTDYTELDDSQWIPYANVSASYNYLPGSYVQGGILYTKNRTDLINPTPDLDNPANQVLDEDTFTFYAIASYKIMPNLTGTVTGQLQYGEFNGGDVYDGEAEGFYIFGAHLLYDFNRYFGVEVGYNYDRADSDIPSRSYTRNRAYIGVRGTY